MRRILLATPALVTAALTLSSCGGDSSDSGTADLSAARALEAAPSTPEVLRGDAAALRAALREYGPVEAIVLFADPLLAGPAAGDDTGRLRAERDAIRSAGDAALAPLDGMHVATRWSFVPAALVTLEDEQALDSLLARPSVLGVVRERLHTEAGDVSMALIGQPALRGSGRGGAGATVAVVDGGVDWRARDLGSCDDPGVPGESCRVRAAVDIAPDDGERDPTGHGTAVASVVARVAPEADIVSLDVFDGATARTRDIIGAVDWAIANRDTHGIVALNLALATGAWDEPCSDAAYGGAFARARAAGILPIAAAGNDGHVGALSAPACVPEVLSVGAVHDADRGTFTHATCTDGTTAPDAVACFSNTASFLDLLAPGVHIAVDGRLLDGTSLAAAHVSGVAALLAEDSAGPDALQGRLVAGGAPVRDARSGALVPRLDAASAERASTQAVTCAATPSATSVTIPAQGASSSLAVDAPAGCNWEIVAGDAWLSVGPEGAQSGPKTLYYGAAPNRGTDRTTTVTLPASSGGTAPAITFSQAAIVPEGTISVRTSQGSSDHAWSRTRSVTLYLSASDASQMCVSGTPTCTSWQTYSTSRSWTLDNVETADSRVYVQFRNASGATSTQVSDTIGLDMTAPTGGAIAATRTTGAITLSTTGVTDALSGVATQTVYVAEGHIPPSCSTTDASLLGTIPLGGSTTHSGVRDDRAYGYRVCISDVAGNTTSGLTTYVTPTQPDGVTSGGSNCSISPASTSVTVAPAGDAGSLRITVPDGCAWEVRPGADWLSAGPTGTRHGSVDLYYGATPNRATQRSTAVTLRDAAGADTVVTFTQDPLPPTGTVSVYRYNGVDPWTRSTGVYLYTTATNATHMCVSNTPTCSSWQAYATGRSWTLPSTETADARIYVWYRNSAGVLSSVATATVGLDTTAPTGGTVTATRTTSDITLGITGVTETLSGIDTHRVWVAPGYVPPDCSGTDATSLGSFADGRTLVHSGVLADMAYGYRICSTDRASNTSQGIVVYVTPGQGTSTGTGTTTSTSTGTSTGTGGAGGGTGGGTGTGTTTSTGTSTGTNACIPSVTETTYDIARSGGYGTVAVSVGSGCSWSVAESTATWLALGPSGAQSGPKTLYYGAPPNRGADRTTSITLSGGGGTTTLTFQQVAVPPTGSISLSPYYGSGGWSRSTSVGLSASGSNASAMCISNTTSCSTWQTYTTGRSWTLPSGDAASVPVYAWFRNDAGSVSTMTSASIGLDTTAPSGGAVVASRTTGAIALSFSGVQEALSGVASHRIYYAEGYVPPECSTRDAVDLGTMANGATRTHTGITDTVAYGYRICTTDNAGNVSRGIVVYATPGQGTWTGTATTTDTGTDTGTGTETGTGTGTDTSTGTGTGTSTDTGTGTDGDDEDYRGPVETCTDVVCLNDGNVYTRRARVTLTSHPPSGFSPTSMCIANENARCTRWVGYAPARSWSLTNAAGLRTVRVQFRDASGAITSGSDRITLDNSRPDNGTLTATPRDSEVTLAWSAASDATSGLNRFVLRMDTSTRGPSNCNAGAVAYTGTDTSTTLTGLTNGTEYKFRLCTYDNAGNASRGVTASARPAPEYDAPTASIVVNNGDTWTRARSVTVRATATDTSTVTMQCLSDSTTTCSRWQGFQAESALTLSGTQGEHIVRAWYKDSYGNVTPSAVQDSIRLDSAAPADGTVAVSGGDGRLDLALAGFTDTGSGIVSYVVASGDSRAPTACARGATVATADATATSIALTGLANGTTYTYRVCARDAVGNESPGVVVTGRPASDYTAPAAPTVVIDNGADWTANRTVSIAITPNGGAAANAMCVSWTSTCSSWTAYSSTLSSTMTTTNGARTVSIWLRDANGNTSPPGTDTIGLDTTKPTNAAVSAIGGVGQVELTWSAFVDAHSGVVTYRVMGAPGTRAPSSCTSGTPLHTGSARSYTHTGAAAGSWAFRVCAEDAVGNVSSGTAATATVRSN